MYEDTILPVRNKLRIASESQTRIYFVQEETKKSLKFLKWLELVTCMLCLGLTIPAMNATSSTALNNAVIIISTSSSTILVMTEIAYPYFKRTLPLTLQVLSAGLNFAIFTAMTIFIYKMHLNQELIQTLLALDGITSIVFLVDLTCKIIISTYLYQTTIVKSVMDVGVSAFIPSPLPARTKPPRSVLTATPITYGGTFPIGKNQPPFLPQDRSFSPDDYVNTPERNNRHRSVQTTQFGDCRSIGRSAVDLQVSNMEGVISKPRIVQIFARQEDKGTSTIPPFYLEEERRKKSPWTCSTPNSSRKIEARKQASMSTPITYSGTFAVNKELVPITLQGLSGASPKSSPRVRKSILSEGNSPNKVENAFLDIGRLDQISEEKISSQLSSENCCDVYESSLLPGMVLDDCQYGLEKNMQYELL